PHLFRRLACWLAPPLGGRHRWAEAGSKRAVERVGGANGDRYESDQRSQVFPDTPNLPQKGFPPSLPTLRAAAPCHSERSQDRSRIWPGGFCKQQARAGLSRIRRGAPTAPAHFVSRTTRQRVADAARVQVECRPTEPERSGTNGVVSVAVTAPRSQGP